MIRWSVAGAIVMAAPLYAETNLDRAFTEHVAAVQARDLKRLAATLTSGA